MNEYIKEAKNNKNSDKIEEAVKLTEKAAKEYPDSSNAYAYLGLYTGMMAGETQNMALAGTLTFKSFGQLNKAVLLDSLNIIARLHRGIMGIKVPEFLGKLDDAVKDLEFIIKICQKTPEKVSKADKSKKAEARIYILLTPKKILLTQYIMSLNQRKMNPYNRLIEYICSKQ
jgi:tetratricopeptide (TPR) repeat protein